MRLHAFTLRWSHLAPVPVIWAGGVAENRINDVLRSHGAVEHGREYTAKGVRVVCR